MDRDRYCNRVPLIADKTIDASLLMKLAVLFEINRARTTRRELIVSAILGGIIGFLLHVLP